MTDRTFQGRNPGYSHKHPGPASGVRLGDENWSELASAPFEAFHLMLFVSPVHRVFRLRRRFQSEYHSRRQQTQGLACRR